MGQRELSELEQLRLEHPEVSWVDPDDPAETSASQRETRRLAMMSDAAFERSQWRRGKIGKFERDRARRRAEAVGRFAGRQLQSSPSRARERSPSQPRCGRPAHRRTRASSSSDDPSPSSEPPLGRRTKDLKAAVPVAASSWFDGDREAA
jgi:hypothetical protein